ncbi:hypothetical protein K3495_g11573 [Podosphaera aphanis]|nr:hypothetical protein K3495_g11573 [Podosphaera aphanis]
MTDLDDGIIIKLLESLRKPVDPKKLEEQAKITAEREASQNAKAQERLRELIQSNSTLPVTISSVRLIGGSHTRRSFLDHILNPLVNSERGVNWTLSKALIEAGTVANKLSRFGIYQPGIFTFVDRSNSIASSENSTPIDIHFKVKERGRISLKTGTDLGNAEGSAYGNLTWRNILGGAESMTLNASAGTRTRSSYQAVFESPVLSDPEKRINIDVFASSTLKPWASHEEVLKGAGANYSWVTGSGMQHQLRYSGIWRQITGLAADASPTVRHEAGDSVKSSLTHTWMIDRRDHHLLPTRGYLVKTISEIAGWGPLRGDVGFCKSEIESAFAVPISFPMRESKGKCGVSLTTGLRAGFLYPMPTGFGGEPPLSRINDRFQLGGPTDVRGFKASGLGPRDGPDSIGGDVYAAASTNLFIPLPRAGIDKPIRLQIFANAGRLLALSDGTETKDRGIQSTHQKFCATVAQLKDGFPSLSAGIGLVYVHPVARFELNMSLPLVVRAGEEGRKGLQFGVGINFL